MLALLQASEAVAIAHIAPVAQTEWESSVDWGEHELSSGDRAATLSPKEQQSDTNRGDSCRCLLKALV